MSLELNINLMAELLENFEQELLAKKTPAELTPIEPGQSIEKQGMQETFTYFSLEIKDTSRMLTIW